MSKKPTMKDVAQKAGVSIATVSRFLNDQYGFSSETGKRVEAAIDLLGYNRNEAARTLKTNKTNTIAVLLPQVETSYYTCILEGIEQAAHADGYAVMICHVGCDGKYIGDYLKALCERQVEGIIGCSLPPDNAIEQTITSCGIPTVYVSSIALDSSIPYVKIDDYKAEYAATRYLIDKGHRQIAMLGGSPCDIVAGVTRNEGYKRALLDAGLEWNEKLLQYAFFSYETGAEAMRKLLQQEVPFTAVVACCDVVAMAALSISHKAGLSVPNDFSLIGYDNEIVAKMSIPPLTTVAPPHTEMGNQAFQMLHELIGGKKAIASQILPFSIVERDSVKAITF